MLKFALGGRGKKCEDIYVYVSVIMSLTFYFYSSVSDLKNFNQLDFPDFRISLGIYPFYKKPKLLD